MNLFNYDIFPFISYMYVCVHHYLNVVTPWFTNVWFIFCSQANSNGNVLRSEIVGSIKMRVYLSGMPELRLGLNDKVLFESTGRGKSKSVELEDVKFHQCVRLSRLADLVHSSPIQVPCIYISYLGNKNKKKRLESGFLRFWVFIYYLQWFFLLVRFENDRTISFIPPDGEFELMSYRLNTHVSFFPLSDDCDNIQL